MSVVESGEGDSPPNYYGLARYSIAIGSGLVGGAVLFLLAPEVGRGAAVLGAAISFVIAILFDRIAEALHIVKEDEDGGD